MKKIVSLAAAGVLSLGLMSMTACEIASPCEGMTVTEDEKKILELGGEVEREDKNGNECELSRDGLSWSEDH